MHAYRNLCTIMMDMYTDMHPRHCCEYSCCASRKCTTFQLQLGVTPISSAVALGCMYMRVCACMSSAGQRGRGCRPRMHGRVYPCILGMCRIARAHLPPSSMPAPLELVADNQPAQVTFTLQDLCLNTGLQLSATWQEEASSVQRWARVPSGSLSGVGARRRTLDALSQSKQSKQVRAVVSAHRWRTT